MTKSWADESSEEKDRIVAYTMEKWLADLLPGDYVTMQPTGDIWRAARVTPKFIVVRCCFLHFGWWTTWHCRKTGQDRCFKVQDRKIIPLTLPAVPVPCIPDAVAAVDRILSLSRFGVRWHAFWREACRSKS